VFADQQAAKQNTKAIKHCSSSISNFFLPILSFVFQKCLIRQQTTKQASLAAPTPVLFLNVSTMDYGFYGLLWCHFKTSLSPSMEVHHLHQFSMVPLFLLNSQQDDLRRVASL
jgi:hypothetical protein